MRVKTAKRRITVRKMSFLRKMSKISSCRRQRLDVAKHGVEPAKSMEQAGWLPFDTVANILSWLPVKSLIRFRCVCKQWKSLTYDLLFISEHRTRVLAVGRLALISRKYSLPRISLYDFGENGEIRNSSFRIRFSDLQGYTLSNPVDGLVCMYRPLNIRDKDHCYLFNPASRELAEIPSSRAGPSDRSAIIGLGFDSSTVRYKVVRLFVIRNDREHLGCQVLDVGTQEWRDVQNAPCRMPQNQPAVFLNGALHWIAIQGPNANRESTEMVILAFDLKTETFRSMSIPKFEATPSWVALVEWRGQLFLVKRPHVFLRMHPVAATTAPDTHLPRYPVSGTTFPDPFLRIWRLEDYVSHKWIETHCSDMSSYACLGGRFHVVGIRDDEILLIRHQEGESRTPICSYDLRRMDLHELYHEHSGGLHVIEESIVSPRCLAGDLKHCVTKMFGGRSLMTLVA